MIYLKEKKKKKKRSSLITLHNARHRQALDRCIHTGPQPGWGGWHLTLLVIQFAFACPQVALQPTLLNSWHFPLAHPALDRDSFPTNRAAFQTGPVTASPARTIM